MLGITLVQLLAIIVTTFAVIWTGIVLVFGERMSDFTHDSWHKTIARGWWGDGVYGNTCLYWLVKLPVGLAVYTILFCIVFAVTGAGLRSYQMGECEFRLWWISPVTFWKFWAGPALAYGYHQLVVVNPDAGRGYLMIIGLYLALIAVVGLAMLAIFALKELVNRFCPEMKRPEAPIAAE